jgi:hypothetical protein
LAAREGVSPAQEGPKQQYRTGRGRKGEDAPYYTDGEIWMAKLVARGEKAATPAKLLPVPALIQVKDKMFSWASRSGCVCRPPE